MTEHPERENRLRKLAELRQAGLEGYALRYPGTISLAAARALWEAGDRAEKPPARVAGRLLLKRVMGKLSFASLRDASGDLQLAFEREALGERYEVFKKFLELADVIGCEGRLGQTQKGETTLYVEAFELLSKALLPLPEKYHGLTDPELRYRQRHLDLIVNREVAEVFRARALILREIRAFLDERGFIEVETPVLQPIYGGAAARPFTTHHRALDLPLYLRIADELYLKRLIVGGLERVYELSKNFRNEGIDKFHNPEFSFMECYQAWADYHDMMELVESLVLRLALKLRGAPTLTWEGETVDLQPPWPRLPIIEAIRRHADVDVEHKTADELRAACTKLGISCDPAWGAAKLIDEIFSAKVEPELLGPVFITDYPIETTPLARRHREHPHLVERFECFLFRREFGNAYSELNDPIEQRRRLEQQQALLAGGDAEAHPLDEDFLAALEQGLPPTGGLGLGVDRLVMFLTGAANIRDVILFPLLRPQGVSAASD